MIGNEDEAVDGDGVGEDGEEGEKREDEYENEHEDSSAILPGRNLLQQGKARERERERELETE